MDRRNFLRRAPAAAIVGLAATQLPGVTQATAAEAPELMVCTVTEQVDRKVADITYRPVLIQTRRRKRRSKAEMAEAKRLAEQQVLYERMGEFSPEAIQQQWERLHRTSLGGAQAEVEYSIISYTAAPRTREAH